MGQNHTQSMGNQLLWRLFLRQLLFVTVLNLVLYAVVSFGMVAWVEESIRDVAVVVEEQGLPTSHTIPWLEANLVSFTYLDRPAEGVRLEEKLPFPHESTKKGLRNYSDYVYSVEFHGVDTDYALTMDLENFDILYRLTSLVVLSLETCFLMFNLFGNNQTVRQTFRPIQDLAATATMLNSLDHLSKHEMELLAGELDKINATHLDTRISLPSTHRELKSIALAINSMLDRVTEAYDAQMRFVSDASHELRTPIAVIQGYSSMLDRWGKSDPAILQESISAIREESKSMELLMEQLLFLARGDNQSQAVKNERLNLTDLAKEVIREEEMLDPSRTLISVLEKEFQVEGDMGLLKQLLRILVDNSLKYTTAEGRVWLKLIDRDTMVEVVVQDEGMGIPAKSLPHIFQRFYRTDVSRTRETGGTGLGLSIATWIASQHNTWFEVTSREEIGTRISFKLPLVEEL